MIGRPESIAILRNLAIRVSQSILPWDNPEDDSFSEKTMTEKSGDVHGNENPFTSTGERSTLAMLGNLCDYGSRERGPEESCGSKQAKESEVPEPPIPTQDSNWWKFPSAQPLPSTLIPQGEKPDRLNVISGYSASVLFGGKTQSQGPSQIPGPPSRIDDEEEMELDDRDDDAQSSDSSRTNTLTDSLRALPNRISRMEEQWRDMLREVKGFMTHSDARMGDMRLELLHVKKLALRDSDSVRDMATDAKYQTDVQAIDLDSMQKKLCQHEEQLKDMGKQIHENDLKHTHSYEKLLDTMNATNVTLERILERLDQQPMSRRSRSPSPRISRNLHGSEGN